MNSTNNSKTGHTSPVRPILKRRKKSQAEPQEKVLLKRRKKKESLTKETNIIIKDKTLPLRGNVTNTAERVRLIKRNKNKEKTNKKEIKIILDALNPTTKRRNLMNYQEHKDYYKKQMNLADKQDTPTPSPQITKKMEMIFSLWDNLANKHNNLGKVSNQKRTSKAFKILCSLTRSYLAGTLPRNKNVVLPEREQYPNIKCTPKDFAEYLFWFNRRLKGDHCKRLFFKQRINLATFFAGVPFSGLPSIFLQHCLDEPGQIKVFKYEEYFPILKNKWAEYGGVSNFINRDYENFDLYLSWAIPKYTKWLKNFNSMNNFEDESDVLEFFTFGALRKFKNRRKSFNSGILNQEFFKKMIEELRQHHGYTV